MIKINEIEELINIFKDNNITPILVGGYVRDSVIDTNLISKDIDIEVYNSNGYDSLAKILDKYNPKLVGEKFGVIKININGLELDISLPRKENSIGKSHKDFEIEIFNTLSFPEAFKRRDFTINGIGYDLINNQYIDIYNGFRDINKKIIKHIDKETFIEDPLRIFRAIQFAARFDFNIDVSTKKLMREMIENDMLDDLSKERIFEEFNKLLLKSAKPSVGFELMREFKIIEKYFPELNAIIEIPQDEKYHPEGDVWTHTMMVIDAMANIELPNDKKENKLIYMYSCLCHDFGKYTHTQNEAGKITSKGHEEAGIEPTISFMKKLTDNKKLISKITPLVECHLRPTIFYKENYGENAIKKLSNKLLDNEVDIIDLAIVNKADSLGRTTLEAIKKETPQYDWIIDKYNEFKLNIKTPKLITGKYLIEKGHKPNKQFGIIIDDAYEYQIQNNITETQDIENYIFNKYSDVFVITENIDNDFLEH